MTKIRISLLCLLLALPLAACDNAKRSLGLERQLPDEFRVVSRAPLTVPPDFTLQPPTPGTKAAQNSPVKMAESALLGAAQTPTASSLSPLENALLSQTGGDKAGPSIRATIDLETAQMIDADRTLIDKIRDYEPQAEIVDAQKEKERLDQNKAQNLPANSGEVPIIKIRRKGLLEGIF